ncbi:penicillin-binding protein [Natronoflexus pectinivorans]|uniref:Cell division protein FtsI (Penicillin-binding protein 3) n=1 Tax=Natronoflexus pectinivorans TaxID=682526 RepID=A0A4R2GAI1_9BACT|nr:penicillin-binding protein [Natronoflexus pectinivorans]TCO04958.1 cell division protein FtsI (penicillin-binding protein 3) [Natronoflexus pectinivorans]
MAIKRSIIFRVGIIYLFFLGLSFWLIFELISLKLFEADQWKAISHSGNDRNIVDANRGEILDVNGRKLACSVPSYRLYMDLLAEGLTDELFNAHIDSLAWHLSNFFRDKSAAAYKRDLTLARQNGRRYHMVHPRRISYTDLQKVNNFPLFRLGRNRGGFIPEQFDRRELPFGSLAARTIGKLYGESSKGGMVGLEHAYNDVLSGTPGSSAMKRVSGRWVPEVVVPPVDGLDIVTTIDIAIQDVAEHALRNQLVRHNASHGVAILMEVQTGAIKAIANLHRIRQGVYIEDYFNYAIGASTEPGSTFKLPVIMAALEDRAIRITDSIDTGNGAFRYFDQVMRDSNPSGFGKLSVSEIFEKSSNIGISRIIFDSYKDNPRRFVDRLYNMDLNQPLGVEIHGEGRPLIKYPGDNSWSGTTLPWMSIGYEVKLTPLQTLTFYNAVANKGRMVKPKFVKGYSRHGRMVKRFSSEVINPSIASRETIETAHQLLLGVVERGTATNIRNRQYTIAGKTGTAQVARGAEGYRGGGNVEYQASFVGYFPADNPRYSCIVVVSAPSNNVYYGNVVAGTVFREISDRVYATTIHEASTPVIVAQNPNAVLPFSKGGTRDELNKIYSRLGLPVYDKSTETEWISTMATDSAIVMRPRTIPPGLVPSVIGMGAKDAIAVLENAGLNVHIQGVGRVVSQSLAAGTSFRRGNTIYIRLN